MQSLPAQIKAMLFFMVKERLRFKTSLTQEEIKIET